MRTLPSLALLLVAAGAAAEEAELPRLELGVGLVGLEAADYRGSRNESTYLFVAPYIKYRGDRVRVDEGVQGILFEQPDLRLSLSGNLSLPVDEDSPERAGMDELDAIIEIGPSIDYRFRDLGDSAWWIDLPLRFAYTVDGELESIGRVFQPRLSWRKPARALGDWKLRFNIGPVYSSEEHHEYFYSVAPADAIAGRPAYDADGGFSGLRAEFTWSRRIREYWIGGFLRYDSLRDAEIEDSPLVSETEAWMVGLGGAWVFYER